MNNEIKKTTMPELLSVGWYPFKKGSSILFYNTALNETGSLSVFEGMDVYFNEGPGLFDYVICGPELEKDKDPSETVKHLKSLLKPEGILLLIVHNRLGMEYLCGEKDPYTGYALDGLDNYRHAGVSQGRCYSKSELRTITGFAGLRSVFYSVFPSLEKPGFIYREGCFPNEDYRSRVFHEYTDRFGIWLNETFLFEDFQKEGLLHDFANGYVIECFNEKDEEPCDVTQVTIAERNREDSFFTVIHGIEYVEKKNFYPEGKDRFSELVSNHEYLRKRGIKTVEDSIDKDGRYTVPFIDAPTGQEALRCAAQKDKSGFLDLLDRFVELIYRSSEESGADPVKGSILKKAYPDMIPLNSFFVKGEFVFFDQEYVLEDIPAKVIVTRTIDSLRRNNPGIDKICEEGELYKRYEILDNYEEFNRMQWDFLNSHIRVCDRKQTVVSEKTFEKSMALNRDYIDKGEEQSVPLEPGMLVNIGSRDLILFGSGTYAEDFLDRYGRFFKISAVADNDPSKAGKLWHDIPVISPDELKSTDKDVFVLICMRRFRSVKWQLIDLGFKNFGIYNKYCDYILPVTGEKKYKTGYVAGAFDMFHIGHLNLLRRAKEYCDYLIVGVISDERIFELKNKKPIIPCNERIQVVAGCRYADRVEGLPVGREGIREAYEMFRFDCMFSGDDHANHEGWLADREYLRTKGSDIVFVPYTRETSSSAIRTRL